MPDTTTPAPEVTAAYVTLMVALGNAMFVPGADIHRIAGYLSVTAMIAAHWADGKIAPADGAA